MYMCKISVKISEMTKKTNENGADRVLGWGGKFLPYAFLYF